MASDGVEAAAMATEEAAPPPGVSEGGRSASGPAFPSVPPCSALSAAMTERPARPSTAMPAKANWEISERRLPPSSSSLPPPDGMPPLPFLPSARKPGLAGTARSGRIGPRGGAAVLAWAWFSIPEMNAIPGAQAGAERHVQVGPFFRPAASVLGSAHGVAHTVRDHRPDRLRFDEVLGEHLGGLTPRGTLLNYTVYAIYNGLGLL